MITAIIPTYNRQANLDLIVPALRSQTFCPNKIVVVDNSCEPYRGPEVDAVWSTAENVGPFYKFLVATFYTGWLYFNDDDILPKGTDLLERLVGMAEQHPGAIVGVRARNVHKVAPHYKHDDEPDGLTNNVKMGCALMHRSALSAVRIPWTPHVWRCDDIYVSLEVGRGEKVHFVDHSLNAMIEDMPGFRAGYSSDAEHYNEREEFCKLWLSRNSQ
jgi:hypothetical protein